MPATVEFRCECDHCGSIFMAQSYSDLCESCKRRERKRESTATYAKRGGTDTFDQRHGPDFESQREKALEQAGYECEQCGISDEEHRERDDLFPPNRGLHVHHIVDTTEFETREEMHALDNLAVLCADCHQ